VRGLGLTVANGEITLDADWINVAIRSLIADIDRINIRSSPDVKSIDAGPYGGVHWSLGTWNAEQGGHILRLRVTYCGYGSGAIFGAKMYYQPIDLNILIHTLDGQRLPTNTDRLCGAWGYAWFICGYAAPAYVFLGVDSDNIDQYQVYLYTSNHTGHILVEASTTAAWTPNVAMAEQPATRLPIQCIPVQTHMSTTSTYKRSPTEMPFTTVP
jgi:hypothetical protein